MPTPASAAREDRVSFSVARVLLFSPHTAGGGWPRDPGEAA